MTEQARARMARVLGLEVALLAAEVELLEELIGKGILPEGARRTPTGPEIRAGVRFAELDRIVNDAALLLVRHADRVRDRLLDGLAEQLAGTIGTADPWQALDDLARLTDPTNPAAIEGLADVIRDVEAQVAGDLEAVARAGHAEAVDEARRQGLPDRLLPVDVDPVDDTVRAAARAQAAQVAQKPATRLLDVAAQAGAQAATAAGATGATVVEAALNAAEDASRKGIEDTARQAANVTHGLGRTAAQTAMPDPAEVYASELLDRNTCGPCADVDGRTYESLDAGLVDYPGAGGYAGCDGGSRCRGTLVIVHRTEAAPTLDTPGRGPAAPGGPPDRTPRGPSMPPPPTSPAAVAPASVPPDVGVPAEVAQPAAPYPQLDDTGRTVIPADVDTPITTVPPSSVARDPELSRLADDDLDAIMADPWASDARKMAAADEYDQRAAGTASRVFDEETLDAATLAQYEADRAAWERAGGYAADSLAESSATAQAGGRAIDRVRAAWTEEVEQMHIRADFETNGYLIAKDKVAEFRAKYDNATAVMFEGPARVAYYYASPELRAHWEAIGGRPTFSEFAVERGITDAKTRARAAAARGARDDAALRADESASGRAKRAAQKARKPRRQLSAGDRLALEQKRRDRIRAQERKLRAQAQADGTDLGRPAATEGDETP